MEKAISKAAARQRRLRVHRGVRYAVQIAFFVAFPAVFSASFNGVKYAFTQIGLMQPVELSSFVVLLLGVLAFTVVFGRFFCGYACAFGTLGDVLYALLAPVRKKLKLDASKMPVKARRVLQSMKYLVLVVVCALCFTGVWSRVSGLSPWTAFAGIVGGNIEGIAIGAFVALGAVCIGMMLVERFFCQFLCPLGAVFSLMPVLPLSAFRRDADCCLKGCNLCKRTCPVAISPDPDAVVAGECISCGRCADGCPIGNIAQIRIANGNEPESSDLRAYEKMSASRFLLKIKGSEIPTVLVKAAILFALCRLIM